MIWLFVGWQAAHAEDVSWRVTSAQFGCPSCSSLTAATSAALASAALAGWDSASANQHLEIVSQGPDTLSNGVYTTVVTWQTTYHDATGSLYLTGTCASSCTGDTAPAGTAWSSTPKMLQAIFVAFVAGMFFFGVKVGRTA